MAMLDAMTWWLEKALSDDEEEKRDTCGGRGSGMWL